MIKLNVKQVLKRQAEEKARVKPLPKVRVKGSSHRSPILKKILAETPPEVKNQVIAYGDAVIEKNRMLKELWAEMGQLKRDRGKVSSSIAWKVGELEAKLTKESKAMAEEFIKGNLPMPELESLAAQIQSFTDRMTIVWDKIRHVEQYGVLPTEVTHTVQLQLEESSVDVKALQHEIRRLDDLIYKCNKKLQQNNSGIKAPTNTGKVAEWKEKVALADARRFELKLQLKKLQYGARVENGTTKD